MNNVDCYWFGHQDEEGGGRCMNAMAIYINIYNIQQLGVISAPERGSFPSNGIL
jgi:hypothetical protein